MNNVSPPSRFTACILLHTYTQQCSQSSAGNSFRFQVSGYRYLLEIVSLAGYTRPAILWRGPCASKDRGGVKNPRPDYVNPCCWSALLAGLLEVVYDGRVCQGRDIPQVVLALCHAAED